MNPKLGEVWLADLSLAAKTLPIIMRETIRWDSAGDRGTDLFRHQRCASVEREGR